MSLAIDVKKKYNGFQLDVQLVAESGVTGVLGASGAGKSMTLKAAAGLMKPDAGSVALDGRALYDSRARLSLPPQRRGIGYLFQNYALFPHMTVLQNVLCARGATEKAAMALLDGLEMGSLLARYPGQLSGGQQQRAALARCLAARPRALLLDEPFSALDEHLREKMQLEVMGILRSFAGPAILVTHNRDEVFKLSTRLAVMDGGSVIAEGETKALFRDPGRIAAARLTGCKNISRARLIGPGRVYCVDWGIELQSERGLPDGSTHVGVRAHDFEPAREGCPSIPMRVIDRYETPFAFDTLVDTGGKEAIWWKSDRSQGKAIPRALWVSPRNVMPLR